MPDNFKVSSDIDTLLRKQTKEEAATFLGLEDVSAVWGQVTGTLSNQTDLQGALDTNASGVATNASNIATNTAAIAINTAKTGITSGQASAIVANTAKVGITPTQASDITANNAKVGITPTQASGIVTNTSNIAANASNITNLSNLYYNLVIDVRSVEQGLQYNAVYIQNIARVVIGLVTSGDNSSKIQAVIDSVAANGGGDVVIPAGTWEIASTLVISTSNVRLRGQGGGWNHDVGVQGTQAATTLKWIGTEFDGAVVISGSLDGAGAGVTKNGTRLGTVNGFATSDVAKYQGMLIEHVSSGVYDLIMDSDNGYVEIKADSNAAWADSQSFKLYKPSVMVEVKSVYGDGTTDQQIINSGVSRIHFDCQDAHIGLRVITASNGEYKDLSFIEPRTAAIYMGVKNIGSMDKPATVSQDPQFNDFENIVSRNFTGGKYGGIFVATGVLDWVANTSFNNFRDFRSFHNKGDAFILGSSDANLFENCLALRAAPSPSGHALKLLGTNRVSATADVPRGNRFTQFASTGGGQILCYGTDNGSSGNVNDVDIYQYPSHDNHFPILNVGNGTPLPQIGFEADAFYDTDNGHEYFKMTAGLVVGADVPTMNSARANVTTESLRIASTLANHMILQGQGSMDWKIRVDGDDLKIAGTGGDAELKLGNRTSLNAGFAPKIASYSSAKTLNFWNRTYLFNGLAADASAILDTGASLMTGQEVIIKNGDPTWDVILNSNGKLVDGATTGTTPITLTPKQFITLQWDGTEWWIIGRG